jgi:hypothetical protein
MHVHEQSAANNVPFLPVAVMVVGLAICATFEDPELRTRILRTGGGVAAIVTAALVARWAARSWRLATYRGRSARLRAFAGAIPRGDLDGRGTFQGGAAAVTGVQDGLQLRLVVRAEAPSGMAYELWATNGLPELDVSCPGQRSTGAAGKGPRAARHAELDRLVSRLFESHGAKRVSLHAGVLRVEAPFTDEALQLSRLVAAFRALADVARLVTREEVDVPKLAGRTFVWSAGGGRRRCAVCRADVDPLAPSAAPCGGCRTLHHADCLASSGCAVLGCVGEPGSSRTGARTSARQQRLDERGERRPSDRARQGR